MGCETAFGRFCFFRGPEGDFLNIWAYIDGFNLYNGALKKSPYKWLNVHTLSQTLRPTDQVSYTKFFSAKVDARPNDPSQPLRQMLYWRALRTIPSIKIIEGHFITKKTNLPDADDLDRIKNLQLSGIDTTGQFPKMAHVYRSEEKGTDVNLAVHLVHDAHMKRFDAAIVISNDSDLAESVRIVREELKLPVFVFYYAHTKHPSFQLKQVASRFRPIQDSHLLNNQFPQTLEDQRGQFSKPTEW
jgi:uncharacterized LabA/DUF88 family protein